jgi:hypothetical protein
MVVWREAGLIAGLSRSEQITAKLAAHWAWSALSVSVSSVARGGKRNGLFDADVVDPAMLEEW